MNLKFSDYFFYDETIKGLRWLKKSGRGVVVGTIAGCLTSQGYRRVRFQNKVYQVSHIVWFLHYKDFPHLVIDHIDGNRDNNTISNLRDVSQKTNTRNCKKHRDGKLLGASFNVRRGKWHSYLSEGGKKKHLGSFDTELEAHQKYLQEDLKNAT